jgi:hypothetical protein
MNLSLHASRSGFTAVVKATTGESSVMMTTMTETTNLAASAMAKAG